MPRKNLIRTNLIPYHVTNRSNNKDWYQISMSEVWEIAQLSLSKAYKKYPFDLHAFVLMSNHYHMLIQTPDSNIDKIMFEFGMSFSKDLRKASNRVNKMFGGRYKWSLINSHAYYCNVIRYIYQNPLRANIVKKCEDYPFSSLKVQTSIPLSSKSLKLDTNWLNQEVLKSSVYAIKKGLKKSEFEIRPVGKRPIRLEQYLL